MQYIGALAALGVAGSWSICAILFEYSTKRIGSSAVNFLKLSVTVIVLSIYLYFAANDAWAPYASTQVWLWIGISGVVGFALCDQALLSAFRLIGARHTLLIVTTYPFFAALTAYFILGESIPLVGLVGMTIITLGIGLSLATKQNDQQSFRVNTPIKGILLAFFAAIMQGIGFVLSKKGMIIYEQDLATHPEMLAHIPIASTQIRAFTGFLGIIVMMVISSRVRRTMARFKDTKAISVSLAGTVFGPLLGVTLMLVALQNGNVGIVSTIIATQPILIMMYEIAVRGKRIVTQEIIGTLLAVLGVTLFFV